MSTLISSNCQVGSFSLCVTLRVSNAKTWNCEPESFIMVQLSFFMDHGMNEVHMHKLKNPFHCFLQPGWILQPYLDLCNFCICNYCKN